MHTPERLTFDPPSSVCFNPQPAGLHLQFTPKPVMLSELAHAARVQFLPSLNASATAA